MEKKDECQRTDKALEKFLNLMNGLIDDSKEEFEIDYYEYLFFQLLSKKIIERFGSDKYRAYVMESLKLSGEPVMTLPDGQVH